MTHLAVRSWMSSTPSGNLFFTKARGMQPGKIWPCCSYVSLIPRAITEPQNPSFSIAIVIPSVYDEISTGLIIINNKFLSRRHQPAVCLITLAAKAEVVLSGVAIRYHSCPFDTLAFAVLPTTRANAKGIS